MKRTMIAAVLLVLAACSGEEQDEAGEREAVGNEIAETRHAPAAKAVAAERAGIERKDDVLSFGYGWPAAAASIKPLDAWLHAQAETQYRDAHEGAEEGRRLAEKGDYPFNGYEHHLGWRAVADTPAVLVMQGDGYSYTGGAHGLPFTVSLIWDRAAQRRLATAQVIDIARLSETARDAFCAELDRQREKKRGAPVDPAATGGIPEFNRCVGMKQQEILPLSRGGKALDAIRVVIGPYEAGPYAEGTYEIDLPMTPAMVEAVMPAYRGWFETGTP